MNVFWEQAQQIGTRWQLLTDAHRCTEEEVAAAENRLGVRLPEMLRAWYLWGGKRTTFEIYEDELLLPEELRLHDNHLVFGYDREGMVGYAIAPEALIEADPYWSFTQEYGPDDKDVFWGEAGFTLAHYLRDKLLEDTFGNSDTHFYGYFPLTQAQETRLRASYATVVPEVAFSGLEGTNTFWGEDIFFCFERESHVRVTARTKTAIEHFCHIAAISSDRIPPAQERV
jgi:hypothetical protein